MGILEENYIQGEQAVCKKPTVVSDNNNTSNEKSGTKPAYSQCPHCDFVPMKVFISLPISNFELEDVKERCNKFVEKLKRYVSIISPNNTVEIVTPFDLCPETDKPYSYYMGKDIEALLECTHIISMKGWTRSRGCMAEFSISQIYSIAHSEEYEWYEHFAEKGITD